MVTAMTECSCAIHNALDSLCDQATQAVSAVAEQVAPGAPRHWLLEVWDVFHDFVAHLDHQPVL